MNAERMHALASQLVESFTQGRVIKILSALINNLQAIVNAPQDPAHQTELAKTRERLEVLLRDIETNHLPPTIQKVAMELGLNFFIGHILLETIDAILDRNNITPAVAQSELTKIRDNIQQHIAALTQLVASLEHFEIEKEVLLPGEAEFSVLIPRDQVSNQLDNFGGELEKIDRILKVFSEFSTGQATDVKINQISSSDLSVFLDVAPEVGAFLALGLERLVALYKNILEVRKLNNDLRHANVPNDLLKQIDEHLETKIRDGIDTYVREKMGDMHEAVPQARKNELETALKAALHDIAFRIDRGYSMDVRAGVSEKDDNEENDEDNQPQALARIINNASSNLQFVRPPGDPVLLESAKVPDDKGDETAES